MSRRSALLALAATASCLAAATWSPAVLAQSDSPLRIIVPYAPGGSSDRAARIVADKLGARLGQTVIVENKAGAGGRLAMQQAKNTPASQSVLVLANPATMVVAPLVFKDNGYDPDKDFQPVSQISSYEFGLAVSSAVPVKELQHLLAWLRANPQQANFGVPATGSLPHFFALMTSEAAKVPAQVVGYRGSGPLVTDLIGGQIPVAVDTLDTLLPQHEAGKLRILASSADRRSPFGKDIPTYREAGLNLVATGWNAFFAPASMPRERVAQLGEAIRAVMLDEDTRRKFNDARVEPVSSSPQQMAAMLKAYRAQWAPVVQKSGYQP
ncbi:ABC transporter substrate-binding protein [Melaminivora suipulveris]|uniref:ABC transporter substrate-binding protein n=1 Tax=Melaminivora suipulveris TaxID=2109913 RepID=A0A2R3QBT1_9BURK|nr:Bug family tripartite tricarboxylate transporter substrate binding protein [Melaminivora suipulveris]AVO49097.1 ABC transporter substrate-binding protein [Melaminivora suipulveris]